MKTLLLSPRLLSACAIFLLAFIFYAPTLQFDFAYDDLLQVQLNELVRQQGQLADNIVEIFKQATSPGNLYRPITTLSYRLDFILWGMTPTGFHLTNVILFSVICAMVFLLPHCFLSSDRPMSIWFLAWAAALIFIVHPIHVEAVANIVGRAELLACLLCLTSLNLFICSLHIRSRLLFALTLALGALAFTAALASKESALPFLLLIPLAAFFSNSVSEAGTRKTVIWFICLLIGAIGVLYLRALALGDDFFIQANPLILNPENPLLSFPVSERILHALRILGDYLVALLAPIGLSADYSSMPAVVVAGTFSISGIFSLVVLFVSLALTVRYHNHVIGYFGIWFFLAFALTSNIIIPIGTVRGDRLAFMPSIGAIIFFLAIWQKVLTGPFLRGVACIVTLPSALIIFAALAQLRIGYWRNNQSLFSQTVIDSPDSPKAYYNYGVYLRAEEHNQELARKYFLKTLEIYPEHILSMKALADIALEQQQFSRVEYWYKKIISTDAEDRSVDDNLDKLLRYKEAIKSSE